MKKLIFILSSSVILFFFIMCETDDKNQSSGTLNFIEAVPGGCNLDQIDLVKSAFESEDSVNVQTLSDTLNIFVGINYVCSAPFATETIVVKDSIFINLNDTCPIENGTCYAKCMCYYSWNFFFNGLEEKEYYFKIILNDPRQENPSLIKEGVIEISQIN